MPFHIRNKETDALARRLAQMKGVALTRAVHEALRHELDREIAQPALSERAVSFCRDLRARGHPEKGRPADKAFFDELSGGS